MITEGCKIDNILIVGYDEEGNGYGVSEGVRISVPASRISDCLGVQIVSCSEDGKRATAKIISVKKRRAVRGYEPPFNESELDQIERSIPKGSYVYSKKLKLYHATQAVHILGIKGKQRIIFVRPKLEDENYEAHITNILDRPAEEILSTFYSHFG